MPRPRLTLLVLCAAALGLAWPIAVRGAVDPFYANLLEEGSRDLARGQHKEAARALRIATFGLLEEPPLLADGLVRLALAQAALGEEEGFRLTFRRLSEAESRLGAYAAAATPPDLKGRFEAEAGRRISREELLLSAFAALAEQRAAPPASGSSRRELEARLRADPADTAAMLSLAEVLERENRLRPARRQLDRLLALEPGNGPARCLRGRIRLAARDDCAGALADLGNCAAAVELDPPAALRRLECAVDLERWDEAATLLETLPEAARVQPRASRLAARIGQARPAGPAGAREASTGSGVAAPPEEITSARPQGALEGIRDLLRRATRAEDLGQALDRARRLAAAEPDWSEAQILAAEVSYHAALWDEAVRYFRSAGEIDPERPDLHFYLAVSLWESGGRDEAAAVLRRALPALERSAFVESYVRKILAGDAPSP